MIHYRRSGRRWNTGADGSNDLAGFANCSTPARDEKPPASMFEEVFDLLNVEGEEDTEVDTPEFFPSFPNKRGEHFGGF
ncbi:hypothetical protein NMY22_g10962 [Coprinellus aureogranulatus]|nr:hypothetical protein NMY22_g10962 [Coprinellus aureogranulatus]